MPWREDVPNLATVLLAQAMRRFRVSMAIRPKRMRRAVPYADELLARQARLVAAQKAQAKR